MLRVAISIILAQIYYIPFHVFRPLSRGNSELSGLCIQSAYCPARQSKYNRIDKKGNTNRQEEPDAL